MNMEDVEARLRYFSHVISNEGVGAFKNKLKQKELLISFWYSHAIEQGGLKDREIKSVRRQLDSRDDELAEMTRGREVALKENRRLQTDLNAMTEEHQVSENVIHHIFHTTEGIFQWTHLL